MKVRFESGHYGVSVVLEAETSIDRLALAALTVPIKNEGLCPVERAAHVRVDRSGQYGALGPSMVQFFPVETTPPAAPPALTDTTRDLMWLVPGKGGRFVVMAVRIPAGQWVPGAMVRATVEGRAVLIPPAELVYYTPPDAAPNVGAAVQGDTQETSDMNPSEPAPVLANLAESINAAFGPPLRASVESGRLVLRTRDVEAHIDASGEIQTAMDTAPCPTDADAPHVVGG